MSISIFKLHCSHMTVLLKIILKEREGKKGKKSVEQESSGLEEQADECLPFTDDLTQEAASQEGKLKKNRYSEIHILQQNITVHCLTLIFFFFLQKMA